jgi:ribA/ribD-fused uncharacterized protein
MNKLILSKSSNCFLHTTYPCIIKANNMTFNSSLQYYVKTKQEKFDKSNNILSTKIMNTNDPEELQYISKYIKNYNNYLWNMSYKYSVMLDANLYKFSQNNDLKNKLLSTNSMNIIYSNNNDKIWGIDNTMRGWNLLGQSLNETRDIMKLQFKKNC